MKTWNLYNCFVNAKGDFEMILVESFNDHDKMEIVQKIETKKHRHNKFFNGTLIDYKE